MSSAVCAACRTAVKLRSAIVPPIRYFGQGRFPMSVGSRPVCLLLTYLPPFDEFLNSLLNDRTHRPLALRFANFVEPLFHGGFEPYAGWRLAFHPLHGTTRHYPSSSPMKKKGAKIWLPISPLAGFLLAAS